MFPAFFCPPPPLSSVNPPLTLQQSNKPKVRIEPSHEQGEGRRLKGPCICAAREGWEGGGGGIRGRWGQVVRSEEQQGGNNSATQPSYLTDGMYVEMSLDYISLAYNLEYISVAWPS